MEILKIRFCGVNKIIEKEELLFNNNVRNLLNGKEFHDRLIIQNFIDTQSIKSTILYDGNTVYGKDKIFVELKRLIKSGNLERMSDNFYHFLTNACGSIAHYNKNGWINEYDNSIDRLMGFFLKNEFNSMVNNHIPSWHSDLQIIANELVEIATKYKKDKLTDKKVVQINIFEQLSLFG